MSYLLYKLKFPNGIHVGANNSLESTELGIHSDTFYSALYSEYMKIYGDDEMLKVSENGEFRVSDLFPFKEIKKETVFYLPKPYVSIDRKINNYFDNKNENQVKIHDLSTFIPHTPILIFHHLKISLLTF